MYSEAEKTKRKLQYVKYNERKKYNKQREGRKKKKNISAKKTRFITKQKET